MTTTFLSHSGLDGISSSFTARTRARDFSSAPLPPLASLAQPRERQGWKWHSGFMSQGCGLWKEGMGRTSLNCFPSKRRVHSIRSFFPPKEPSKERTFLSKVNTSLLSFGLSTVAVALLAFHAPEGAIANSVDVAPQTFSEVAQVSSFPVSFLGQSKPDEVMFSMDGMSMPNFNPRRYIGRWYEVSSIKRGFSGQGQEDCHCTQGVYSLDEIKKQIEVNTFCVHGSPEGYLTGIRGKVTCVGPQDLARTETELEKLESIKEKCFLRFPSIPFIPKLTYDVIDTDYDTFALVSGATDRSFVQIYSRIPNPGPEFIQFQKSKLVAFGFKEKDFRDTPQDCPVIELEILESMMSKEGMDKAMDNVLPGKLPSPTELEQILKKKK